MVEWARFFEFPRSFHRLVHKRFSLPAQNTQLFAPDIDEQLLRIGLLEPYLGYSENRATKTASISPVGAGDPYNREKYAAWLRYTTIQ